MIKDGTGRVVEVAGVWMDITARKAAEQALAAEQTRFRTIMENIFDVIAVRGLDGTIRYITPSVRTAAGVRLGSFEIKSAAAPATWGAAMLVPFMAQ